VIIDTNGRSLVSGGQEGLRKFNTVFENQEDLARREYLSGEWWTPVCVF
jgi:hypothetical protein